MKEINERGIRLVGVIRVICDELSLDDHGRLIEQPALLGKVEKLVRSAEPMFASAQLTLKGICIREGAYEVDVVGAEGLWNPEQVFQSILDQVLGDSILVNRNACLEFPASNASRELSRTSVSLLSAQSEIMSLGHRVDVSQPDGSSRPLSALEPRAMSALQMVDDQAKADRKVSGEITGVLRGRGDYVRIEINRTMIFSVDLTLDAAWSSFQKRAKIDGRARRIDKEDVIYQYNVIDQPDLIHEPL